MSSETDLLLQSVYPSKNQFTTNYIYNNQGNLMLGIGVASIAHVQTQNFSLLDYELQVMQTDISFKTYSFWQYVNKTTNPKLRLLLTREKNRGDVLIAEIDSIITTMRARFSTNKEILKAVKSRMQELEIVKNNLRKINSIIESLIKQAKE